MTLTWKEDHPPGGERECWIAAFPGGTATIETGRDWRQTLTAPSSEVYRDADAYLTVRRRGEKGTSLAAAYVRNHQPVGGATVEAALAAAVEYLKRQAETRYLLDPDPPEDRAGARAARVVEALFAEYESVAQATAGANNLLADGWEFDGPPVYKLSEVGESVILQRYVRRE